MLCEQFGDALCMYKWSIHVRIPIIPIPRASEKRLPSHYHTWAARSRAANSLDDPYFKFG
jgi:hypothetical protein